MRCDWRLNLPAPIPKLYARFFAGSRIIYTLEQIAASNSRLSNKRGWWMRSMTRRDQLEIQSSPNSKQ